MLLYTLGDSFTYGEELPDPTTQSWSAVLADKLGYDLINRGKAGCGNSYIVKTAMKQVPKLKPDIVLVAWTTCARIEVADEYGVSAERIRQIENGALKKLKALMVSAA